MTKQTKNLEGSFAASLHAEIWFVLSSARTGVEECRSKKPRKIPDPETNIHTQLLLHSTQNSNWTVIQANKQTNQESHFAHTMLLEATDDHGGVDIRTTQRLAWQTKTKQNQ
jgi:hypothetical protein